MIAVLVPPGTLVPGETCALEESESHHLRVRRVGVGEVLRLMDGRGAVGQGELVSGGAAATVRVDAVEMVPEPPRLRLVVGAGDRDRFGWLVEKAAELGVSEVTPLETKRTASVANRIRDAHHERLQRRALEAIKQSGAAWAPVVRPTTTVADLAAEPGVGVRWLADAGGTPIPGGPVGPITAVIGPEGGLTTGERQQLLDVGFVAVALGPHILRFETAAVAVAVLARVPRDGGSHE